MSDSQPTRDDILAELNTFPDPETGRGLGPMGQIAGVELANDELRVRIGLTSHAAILASDVQAGIAERLRARFSQLRAIHVDLETHRRPPEPLGELGLRAKSVIAVGSGKGGVGKSTLAVAIACGLQQAGSAVGLMDADVYGPSIPHLLGISGRPEITDERKIRPHDAQGLKVMSMGLLVGRDEAVVWRGPMLHGAITQFLRDTLWGDLDYLIIDMPPGTGDIALTLSQLVPLTGSVVVCTPQDVALLDANKAIAMFQKVKIPILGIVENMSGFLCPECGTRHAIFGSGGARARAEELGVPFLGEVPINVSLRISGDAGGMAEVFRDPQAGHPLKQICYRLVRAISQSAADQPRMPTLPVL